MISLSSSLASSTPATSLKVIFFCCMESRRARDLPKLMALLPPDCIWRRRKNQRPRIRAKGAMEMSRPSHWLGLRSEQASAGFAEAHGLVAAGLHLAQEEEPEAEDKGKGSNGDEQAKPLVGAPI